MVRIQEDPYFYEENGSSFAFPEEASDYEFVLRVNKVFNSVSGKPFAKKNLWKSKN